MTVEKDVVVDEKGEIVEQQAPPENDERLSDKNERQVSDSEHEEDEDSPHPQEEQGAEGETEEEAEARRNRNRARRAENKNRRKEHIESLRREIAARDEILQQQTARLDALERRTVGADMALVDTELKKTVDAYNYYKQLHAEAVSKADGVTASDAQERMFAAMNRAKNLTDIKKASNRPTNTPQPLDPRLKAHAESWMERNDWYDPSGVDADSQIALTIDRQLEKDGWNPTTSQYWEELDARLKKYLPHRYNSGYNSLKRNGEGASRIPVAGSGREGASGSAGGYRLSAERVQALKDAGLWDDAKQRAESIKRFQQYDKEQGVR